MACATIFCRRTLAALLAVAWLSVAWLSVAWSPCSTRAAENDPPAPNSTGELKTAIAAKLRDTHATGGAVVLVSKDDVLWSAEFGLADRDSKRPVTPETIFRAGSIAKSFVSLAALKLQEQGKLRLDDPVRKLVGDAEFFNQWEAADPVRLVHLLEHTAGFDDIALCEFAVDDARLSLRDALAFHPQSRTSRWKPGRFFSYSNCGPPLAAYAVEQASGQTFEDYVEATFLKPLDMPTASFFLTETVEQHLARCYDDDQSAASPYQHILFRPAGALNATPGELAHVVQMLLNRGTFRGKQLLSPDSVERMETAATNIAAPHGLRASYGLGNFLKCYAGFPIHGHEGSISCYLSAYGYSPEFGFGYVCMVTSNDFESLAGVETLVSSYLTRNEKKITPAVAKLTSSQLEQFTGYYEPCTPRFEFSQFMLRLMGLRRFGVEGGQLRPAGPGSARRPLLPVDDAGLFRRDSEPLATLAFVQDEGELFLVSGDLSSVNFRRVSAWRAWSQGAFAVLWAALMLSAALSLVLCAVRRLRGKSPAVGELAVRCLPLIAALCGAAIFAVFWSALKHPVDRLSAPTRWSVGLYALSWAFPLATAAGIVLPLGARRRDVRPAVRRHALAVSLANAVVLAYLAYWGVIGWRSWRC